MNPQYEVDKAVADRHEDGAAVLLSIEGMGHLEAGMVTLAKQFYYGAENGGDAKGFPGLIDAYDSTNMVVDAAGTTADTGSSVWGVKFGPRDVQWVMGMSGEFNISDVTEQRLTDANDNPYTAYRQEILTYPGLQVGSIRSIGRIKKLTADSGKGLTDALISQLLSKFEVGSRPDVLFMSRRSLQQLQASRTATNPTGAPAPFPEESHGVPIEPTDAILDTESLTL